ncbi:Uncharacterised protein [Yersinia frederiksenii]|nr:Uncharacterised protein [Yersinia frederiksenii]
MDAERAVLEQERITAVRQRNDDEGHPRSGLAIRAQARGFQRGHALVTSLAVEASEVRLQPILCQPNRIT